MLIYARKFARTFGSHQASHFNMALREMLCTRCVIDEQKFTEAAGLICGYFGVPKLHEDQQKALRAFLEGRDIYFSAHTGNGKSLVFRTSAVASARLERRLYFLCFQKFYLSNPRPRPYDPQDADPTTLRYDIHSSNVILINQIIP